MTDQVGPDGDRAARTDRPTEALVDALDALAEQVTHARSMPMSASALVNREEVLAAVDRAKSAVPGQIAEANLLLAESDAMLDRARRTADGIIADAHAEVRRLVEEHEVTAAARTRAVQIDREARTSAAKLMSEADDYCDRRLAEFEIDLQRIADQVRKGRDKLADRMSHAPLAGEIDG